MRSILYIFSLLWFVAGLGLLVLGTTLETVPLLQILQPTAAAGGEEVHPVFGNLGTFLLVMAGAAWVLVFCVPALLLSALGAMLGRLDKLEKVRTLDAPVLQPAAPARKRVLPEKVEPHIGRV